MSAMKTIKIRIDTGALSLGGVPPGIVELECGFLKDRALTDVALSDLDDRERNRAVLARVAQHAVCAWSVGELDRAAVERFLLELEEEEPDVAMQVLLRVRDREKLGRPKLLDAEALGNG